MNGLIGKMIAVIHLIIAVAYSIYAFIVPSKFIYDYFYFVFLITLQISWVIFNHECPLSYLYKAYHYPNYNCGDTTTLDDFNELFGSSDKSKNSINYGKLGEHILTLFLIFSIMIAGYRSKIANIFIIFLLFIVLRFAYQLLNNAVGWNVKEILGKENYILYRKMYNMYKIKRIHNEINISIVIIMILFFIYITYANRKRIMKV